jgi:hypothetical protein
MPHFQEAWCSGVDFLYSIDYEGMLDQGEIVADRDLLSLGADELRVLPADTAPVGVGAVPGALLGRKTGEPLPSAVSSARVLKLVGGAEGDPLAWLPLRIAYLLHLACSLLATALADRMADILATGGLPIAGNKYDASTMWHKVTPLFGRGATYDSWGKQIEVPDSLYRTICQWDQIVFLRNAK